MPVRAELPSSREMAVALASEIRKETPPGRAFQGPGSALRNLQSKLENDAPQVGREDEIPLEYCTDDLPNERHGSASKHPLQWHNSLGHQLFPSPGTPCEEDDDDSFGDTDAPPMPMLLIPTSAKAAAGILPVSTYSYLTPTQVPPRQSATSCVTSKSAPQAGQQVPVGLQAMMTVERYRSMQVNFESTM